MRGRAASGSAVRRVRIPFVALGLSEDNARRALAYEAAIRRAELQEGGIEGNNREGANTQHTKRNAKGKVLRRAEQLTRVLELGTVARAVVE